MDVLMPLEQSLLSPINPTIYTLTECNTKLKQNSSFKKSGANHNYVASLGF